MMEKISIIIPLYNAENYISKCLDSIINQTYKNFEIIIINDKSKDDSWEVLNHYVSENLNINFKIVNNEVNLGLSKTRNKGMDLATGDYIFFMDNDDTLVDNFSLQHFIDKTENDPDIILGCLCRDRACCWCSGCRRDPHRRITQTTEVDEGYT